MAFKSDAQRRYFFATNWVDAVAANAQGANMPMQPVFTRTNERTRADRFADRIRQNEGRIVGSGVSNDFANEQRNERDAFISGDAELTESEKRQLLAYSGHFRGK